MTLEALETIIHYRTLNKYDSEIKMGCDFLYYFLTTIKGKQTLGEEYCSILPIFKHDNAFPSPMRRLLFVLLKILGPYYFEKLLKSLERPLSEYVDH